MKMEMKILLILVFGNDIGNEKIMMHWHNGKSTVVRLQENCGSYIPIPLEKILWMTEGTTAF